MGVRKDKSLLLHKGPRRDISKRAKRKGKDTIHFLVSLIPLLQIKENFVKWPDKGPRHFLRKC